MTEGKTIEQAREALFNRIVETEEKTAINSHVSADGDPDGVDHIFASAGYRQRKRA